MNGLLRSPHDRDIARLAVPALGTLVAEPLYVLADTAIVGRLGTEQLAGLALASTVLLTLHSALIFLAYGTTSTVARLVGAGRKIEAAQQAVQGLWLAIAMGVIGSALIAVFAEPLLRALGGDGATLTAGLTYLRISLIGFPFMLIMLAGAGAFNGRQDTRTPLAIAVSGAVANLVIELVLVPGLGYGIGASALSTVIAQVGTGVAYIWMLSRWARTEKISIRPSPTALATLAWAGRALVLRAVALRGSFTLAAAVAARISVPALAAHQIGIQLWSTLALALDAVAIAGQALTGKWLGAGDGERARQAAKRMIQLDVGVGVAAAVVVFAARPWLAKLFTTDPEVIALTGSVLLWVAVTQPLNGYVFALDGILIGAGDMRYLGRTMAVAAAVFAAMAVWMFNGNAGLDTLWIALSVFMVLRAVTLRYRWRTDAWVVLGTDA